MARLVDPIGALASRGYRRAVSGAINLRIVDPLRASPVELRLEIIEGEASCGPAGSTSCTVDAGALAAIYTGWTRARAVVRLGSLREAERSDVEFLEAAFGGTEPWLLDHF
jgi:predicted acetyltransferase